MFANKIIGLVFSSALFANTVAATARADGHHPLDSIDYRIVINGTAEQVWEAMANFEDYHKWNRWTPKIEGEPALGSEIKAYGATGSHLDLKITSFEADKEICWVDVTWFTKLGAGGWRCRRIELLPNGQGVLFINHFQYTGIFGAALEYVSHAFLVEGMQLENSSLKTYIEAN